MKGLSDAMVRRLRDLPEELVDGRFEILAEAGTGGMGTVYRARDRQRDTIVALKVLSSAGGDVERFAVETKILAQLSHPGIVAYVAHGTTESGEPYLAMEWLEGESLSRRLERGPMSLEDVLVLGRAVADALATAHASGVIHRDIKPSNLFLCGGDAARVKVLDFGVARLRDRDRELTRTGQIIGTPGYMAPEQARGRREDDVRADLFSLGCVLFRCLSGKPPFQGGDVLSVLTQLALHVPPSVGRIVPGVPLALDRLVSRLMAKSPADRPSTAEAVRDELDTIDADGEPIDRAPRSMPASTLPTAQPLTQRSPVRRAGKWRLAIVAGVIVVALASVAWTWPRATSKHAESLTLPRIDGPELAPRWIAQLDGEMERAVAVSVRDGEVWTALEVGGRAPEGLEPGGERGAVTAWSEAGAPLWTRRFDGAVDLDVLALAGGAERVAVGGFFHREMQSDDGQKITGAGKDGVFLAHLDRKSGRVERLSAFGESDLALFLGKLALTMDDAGALYLAGGYGGTLDLGCGKERANSHLDAYVAHLAPDGSCRWMHRFGDAGLQAFESVGVDQSGRVTVAGEMQGNVEIGATHHESRGGMDVLVAHFDASGRPKWSRSFGNRSGLQGSVRVAVHPLGHIVIAGWFEGSLSFGKGDLESRGKGHDLFVAKLDASGETFWSQAIHVTREPCPVMSCRLDRIGLAVDAEGGAVVALPFAADLEIGARRAKARGATDFAVVRFDAGGELVGMLQLGDAAAQCNIPDCVLSVAADKRAIAVAGSFSGSLDRKHTARGEDAFLLTLPP